MSDESDCKVFLCYNSKNKPIVEAVAGALKAVGIKYWLDTESLPPGEVWKSLIDKEIGITPSAAIFIGKEGFGPHQKTEVQDFLKAANQRRFPVIPVLLPGKGLNELRKIYYKNDAELFEELLDRTFVNLNEHKAAIRKLIECITPKAPEQKISKAQLSYEQHCIHLRLEELPKVIGKMSTELSKLCDEYTKTQSYLQEINEKLARVQQDLKGKVDEETRELINFLETVETNLIEKTIKNFVNYASLQLREKLVHEELSSYFDLSVKTLVGNVKNSIFMMARQESPDYYKHAQNILDIFQSEWESDAQTLCNQLVDAYINSLNYICEEICKHQRLSDELKSKIKENIDYYKEAFKHFLT